jgi:two-component system chemotaxis sensor kinase CheA
MRARDELIQSFSRTMPERIAAATDLWLGFEEGKRQNLAALRRVLHTLKGEAHMLELAQCAELAEHAESVVDALRKTGEPSGLTGDALLGAFEGIGLASAAGPDDEPMDVSELVLQLKAAALELEAGDPGDAPAPQAVPEAKSAVRASEPPAKERIALLDPGDVGPLVHEVRRLHGEQAVLHVELREAQRMLRALLAEIDPHLSGEALRERITKTLGYGAEVDRRLSTVRQAWSSHEFTVGLTLDELDRTVRRASVVSADRLLKQVVRIGRSTARMLGKQVDLRVEGDAVMDATAERRLEPALLHLVRNAIDHGIESSELRRRRGKPERGTVQVKVAQTDSTVSVTVEDDGGGVDLDKLRRVLSGRVSNLEQLDDQQVLTYLFQQGVTTTDQVTAVSGRGVGLDVALREVNLAGGQLSFETTGPTGTRILLSLPATLRGEVAVPVVIGAQRYAIPTRAVHSVVRVSNLERGLEGNWLRVQSDTGSDLVRLYSLGELLGGRERTEEGQPAVVLQHASSLFAVSVDGYDNPRPISVHRTEELAFRSGLVRGVAPTPDGGVLLLLDVGALQAATRTALPEALPEHAARRKPRVLVVEDAPVARELLCGVLRSADLEVSEATDGREGLMLAHREPPDLVLTDLEMPYMNGIEMIGAFRRSPILAKVPVIVLTTAATEQNLASLAPLGVVAVLSKQRFAESELRKLVARCVNSNA